jgi:hypothetical protein
VYVKRVDFSALVFSLSRSNIHALSGQGVRGAARATCIRVCECGASHSCQRSGREGRSSSHVFQRVYIKKERVPTLRASGKPSNLPFMYVCTISSFAVPPCVYAFYTTTSRFVAWLVSFPQDRKQLWLPKDDLRDSSSWSSPPLVLLRDIHSKLLTQYDCKEEVSEQSVSVSVSVSVSEAVSVSVSDSVFFL